MLDFLFFYALYDFLFSYAMFKNDNPGLHMQSVQKYIYTKKKLIVFLYQAEQALKKYGHHIVVGK